MSETRELVFTEITPEQRAKFEEKFPGRSSGQLWCAELRSDGQPYFRVLCNEFSRKALELLHELQENRLVQAEQAVQQSVLTSDFEAGFLAGMAHAGF